MRFALFRSWVILEYQPIEEDAKIAKRAIFDLVTFSEWAHQCRVSEVSDISHVLIFRQGKEAKPSVAQAI